MVSTKVLALALFLVVAVSIHQSEGNPFKKITKPFKKVVKGIGNVGEKIGKEAGRGVKKIGKEIGRGLENGHRLVGKVLKKPLQGLGRLTYPIVTLLGRRKQGHAEVEDSQPSGETNAPDNEAFDVKLLRLHNQLRTEAASQPALKWDTLLATAAQDWANQCTISYQIFGDSRDDTYGQNIYPVKGDDALPYNAVQMWNSFSDSYAPGTLECKENQDCYPYLQMIWPNSLYVGCAVSKCPLIKDLESAGSVLVCFYTPI